MTKYAFYIYYFYGGNVMIVEVRLNKIMVHSPKAFSRSRRVMTTERCFILAWLIILSFDVICQLVNYFVIYFVSQIRSEAILNLMFNKVINC